MLPVTHKISSCLQRGWENYVAKFQNLPGLVGCHLVIKLSTWFFPSNLILSISKFRKGYSSAIFVCFEVNKSSDTRQHINCLALRCIQLQIHISF